MRMIVYIESYAGKVDRSIDRHVDITAVTVAVTEQNRI